MSSVNFPEIGPPVIQTISIDVVDFHTGRAATNDMMQINEAISTKAFVSTQIDFGFCTVFKPAEFPHEGSICIIDHGNYTRWSSNLHDLFPHNFKMHKIIEPVVTDLKIHRPIASPT